MHCKLRPRIFLAHKEEGKINGSLTLPRSLKQLNSEVCMSRGIASLEQKFAASGDSFHMFVLRKRWSVMCAVLRADLRLPQISK